MTNTPLTVPAVRAALAEKLEDLAIRFDSIIRDGLALDASSKSIASAIINELLVRRALRLATSPASEVRESPTLGSSIDLLIGIVFQPVETLDPNAKHRFYRECGCCGGTDQNRDHYKPDISKIEHTATCPLVRDLPILRAIGLASDARHRALSPTPDKGGET